MRPQEIPTYVAEGMFDFGITGRDWIEETNSDVVSLGRAALLEGDEQPDPGRRRCRRGLAGTSDRGPAAGRAGVDGVPGADAGGSSTAQGIEADVRLSYGATEAKIPEIADCVVDITETGRALQGRRPARSSTPS